MLQFTTSVERIFFVFKAVAITASLIISPSCCNFIDGESYSSGCSKIVVYPKLETHVVVLLPDTAENGGVSYHQHCCLLKVKAERGIQVP